MNPKKKEARKIIKNSEFRETCGGESRNQTEINTSRPKEWRKKKVQIKRHPVLRKWINTEKANDSNISHPMCFEMICSKNEKKNENRSMKMKRNKSFVLNSLNCFC